MGSHHQPIWEKGDADGARDDLHVEVDVEWEHILRAVGFAFEAVKVVGVHWHQRASIPSRLQGTLILE
jgi:hypothetical protein